MHKALIFTLSLAAFAIGKNPEFSGQADMALWTNIDSNFTPQPYATHDITLETVYPMDEGFAFFLGLTAYSMENGKQNNPEGGKSTTETIRESGILIDDIQLHWNFVENGTLKFGSFTYAAGGIKNLYGYSNTTFSSTIFKDQSLYGLGIQAAEVEAYIGIPDTKAKAFDVFAAYKASIINTKGQNLWFRPLININLGGGRDRSWKLGSEYSYSSNWKSLDYLIEGSLALIQGSGDQTWILNSEPSINLGVFSLGMGVYHAFLANENMKASEQTDIPYEQVFYTEPLFTLGPKLALGFPISLENPSTESSIDNRWKSLAKIYLYPTHNAEWNFWAGSYYQESTDPNPQIEFGTHIKANF
jgi:hypothetical protein